MRASLLHPLREPRRARRRGSARRAGGGAPAPQPSAAARPDPEVQRVREAGGPVDRASYSCQCGYLFSAEVSTTVSCPHCGAGQAW
ncbi:MAG TPA: hypothetical protein VL979_00640 [Solirubrobacteraceae bacterium]|nr:hypothetical protein [Solirubrobacteraceae bacterium]